MRLHFVLIAIAFSVSVANAQESSGNPVQQLVYTSRIVSTTCALDSGTKRLKASLGQPSGDALECVGKAKADMTGLYEKAVAYAKSNGRSADGIADYVASWLAQMNSFVAYPGPPQYFTDVMMTNMRSLEPKSERLLLEFR